MKPSTLPASPADRDRPSPALRVMLYTFSSTTAWWRHIGQSLHCASETAIVSDLPEADVDIIPSYYRHMRSRPCAPVAIGALGEAACDDVIARCRLLRHLPRATALKMIGAMWLAINETLDQFRPDVFVCFVIDRYILDLFDRALAARGVRYVGLAIGIIPDHVMLMARGEYLPLREPSDAEVAAVVELLAQPDFKPTYVSAYRFGLRRFLSLWAKFTARWLVFELIMLWRRNPLDFRYLATRSAKCGYRVRLRDWRVMGFLDPAWRDVLNRTPFERRVFVGLSINPEAAIEYWVYNRELVDYVAVVERLAQVFGPAGYRLFIKDHPGQFGFRQVEVLERLARYDCITFVPYEVSGRTMIRECHATFAWTGTVGFEAAMLGRAVMAADGAYYLVDDAFYVVRGMDDIASLPDRISRFVPPADLRAHQEQLVRHLLRSTVAGGYMGWRGFSGKTTSGDPTTRLVESFDQFLPRIARRTPPATRADGSFHTQRYVRSVDEPPAGVAEGAAR
jgi:hypothetical protein